MARKRQTKKSVLSSLRFLIEGKRPASPRMFDLINDAMAWIEEIAVLEVERDKFKAVAVSVSTWPVRQAGDHAVYCQHSFRTEYIDGLLHKGENHSEQN